MRKGLSRFSGKQAGCNLVIVGPHERTVRQVEFTDLRNHAVRGVEHFEVGEGREGVVGRFEIGDLVVVRMRTGNRSSHANNCDGSDANCAIEKAPTRDEDLLVLEVGRGKFDLWTLGRLNVGGVSGCSGAHDAELYASSAVAR